MSRYDPNEIVKVALGQMLKKEKEEREKAALSKTCELCTDPDACLKAGVCPEHGCDI